MLATYSAGWTTAFGHDNAVVALQKSLETFNLGYKVFTRVGDQ